MAYKSALMRMPLQPQASIGALMPLETGTFLPDLNASNPAHTDGINAGDAHLRLIKSVLKNTFPNFTDVALASTQVAIDAAVTSLTGVFKVAVDGTISAPAYSFASEATLGFYRKATNTLALTISGVDVWKISGGGVDIITAGALKAGGVAIFPLQSANIGAAQVLTAALADHNVTYAKLQNSVAANALLGAPTAAGPFQEITLGSGLGISGGVLSNTASVFQPVPYVSNLAIDNNASSPTTKIDISADSCILVDGSQNTQRYFSVAVTLDFATTGANGCDSGTRAANKGYYIYLIGNGTTVASLAALDTVTSPVFPTGYTAVKRVGWYRTDGSSNLFLIRTRDNEAVYRVTGSGNATVLPSVASGASAGTTGSISGVVGPNAYKATFYVQCSGTAISVAPTSSYSSAPLVSLAGGNASVEMMLESALSFWYAATGSGNLAVRGWFFPQ